MFDLATAKKFQFVGGDLALDFCNTVGGKRGAVSYEHLDTCFAYLAWCRQAGLVNDTQARALVARAERTPSEAAAVLGRAVELRDAIFRIFAARARENDPPRADLALLNSELSRSLGRLRVVAAGKQGGFGWQWTDEEGGLEDPLGPIAHSAATLLTDEASLARVRICDGDTCGWLFMDSSKNHSRRWCDMRDCGNRAKIRRHRLKQKHEADGEC